MLKFYNTLAKKKEVFRPLKPPVVGMYNCGLTLYDYGHIGNFRSYMVADLLRRYLEWKGYQVRQVMNFTDVGHMTSDADEGEDKIELAARKQKKDPWQITEFYKDAFLDDSKKLNLLEPHVRPKATEHIHEMIEIINKLINKGHAYQSGDNVFYSVASFFEYGRLSGNTLEKLKVGARLETHPDKRDPRDFALWLHDPKHIMQWDSPFGRGYPGWHIECSAMSMKYLGQTFDIHTGGEDNIFPHHEAEIAQSEGSTGKKFVRYWIHVRHLTVKGEKMSKSKGNFYTLRDLLKKGYDPIHIRYLLLSAHYRTRLNFTEEGIKSSAETVKRFRDFTIASKEGRDGRGMDTLEKKALLDFEKRMDDDLNISSAISVLFGFIRDANKIGPGKKAYEFMLDADRILGLRLSEVKERWFSIREAEGAVKGMIEEREKLRLGKDFKKADLIRAKLRAKGIILEDTPDGLRWRYT